MQLEQGEETLSDCLWHFLQSHFFLSSRNILPNWEAIISKQVKETAAAQLSQPKTYILEQSQGRSVSFQSPEQPEQGCPSLGSTLDNSGSTEMQQSRTQSPQLPSSPHCSPGSAELHRNTTKAQTQQKRKNPPSLLFSFPSRFRSPPVCTWKPRTVFFSVSCSDAPPRWQQPPPPSSSKKHFSFLWEDYGFLPSPTAGSNGMNITVKILSPLDPHERPGANQSNLH
ncbi:uncharacterized protein LOC128812852 [Vidua macroura]|uniref:uncharacterized protein LOC128812852 n=1 Tax=Vidua macroura TaxID=187451 RepID=UPI0023A7D12B|nr:uncharacterized protein LOC128812852 [Vidua macroura]